MSFQIHNGFTNENGQTFDPQGGSAIVEPMIQGYMDTYNDTINSTEISDLRKRCSENLLFSCMGADTYIALEKMIPIVAGMTEKYRRIGYQDSEIKKAEYILLDDFYCLVKIYLDMNFLVMGVKIKIEDIKATYILRKEGAAWKTMVQIDHQILPKILMERGILKAD